MHVRRKRWVLLGGVFGAGIGAVVVSALAVFAGAGIAARADKPVNTDPPTISGTPEEGKTLTGDRGKWDNKPTDFNYFWRRCDKNGGSCSNIGGAHALKYVLTTADVGNTLRLRVDAKNADGTTSSASVPSAVVQKAAAPTPPPPPSRGNGCPTGNGNPDQVTSISGPARLILDALQPNPQVVTRDTGTDRDAVPCHVDLQRARPGRARLRDCDSVQPVVDPAGGHDRRGRLGGVDLQPAGGVPGQQQAAADRDVRPRPEAGGVPAPGDHGEPSLLGSCRPAPLIGARGEGPPERAAPRLPGGQRS